MTGVLIPITSFSLSRILTWKLPLGLSNVQQRTITVEAVLQNGAIATAIISLSFDGDERDSVATSLMVYLITGPSLAATLTAVWRWVLPDPYQPENDVGARRPSISSAELPPSDARRSNSNGSGGDVELVAGEGPEDWVGEGALGRIRVQPPENGKAAPE